MAQSDYSLKFDGAGTSNLAVTAYAQPASHFLWVKFTAMTNGGYGSIGTNTGGSVGLFLKGTSTTTAVLNFYSAGDHLDGTTLSINTWYHVGYTLSQGQTLTFYVNGTATGTTFGSITGATITRFGNDSGDPLTGLLDDIASWSTVLSTGNIGGLAAGTTNPASLSPVVLWRCEEGTGSTANDSSQGGNPGTLNGGTTWSTDVPSVLATAGVNLGDAPTNSGYQSAASSLSWSHVWVGDNRCLSIDVHLLSVNDTVTALTYGGATCTKVGVQNVTGGTGRVECWRIHSADSGAPGMGSNTIAVTISGSLACAGTAVSRTGVDPTTPTEAFNSASGINVGAADATVTITTSTDNCWVHGAVATNDTSITANQTGRNNVSGAAGSGADEDTNGVVHPAGSQVISFTNVGALAMWAIAGYGIRPVTAAVAAPFATVDFPAPRQGPRGVGFDNVPSQLAVNPPVVPDNLMGQIYL